MAFNPAPATWLGAGYAYASNTVTFPTVAGTNPILTELSAAEANATTGDIREVMFAFCEAFHDKYEAIAEADRPTKMTVSKSSGINSDETLTHSFTFTFTNNILTESVAAE